MADQQGWTSGLDDIDASTAELILQLQLEDLEFLRSTASDIDQGALQMYRDEIQQYFATRNATEAGRSTVSTDHVAGPAPKEADDQGSSFPAFTCVVCGDHFNALQCHSAPCGHRYCHADLNGLFQAAMDDRTLYPPKCCGKTIPFNDIRDLISLQLVRIFEVKKEELDDSTPTYCHVKSCSAYIGESRRVAKVATCQKCGIKTCVECQKASHSGQCVTDAAMQETLQLAERQGWRRCPGCERLVELSMGCYHMTCLCRTQFCYLCGALWKSCDCVQFVEDHQPERGQAEDQPLDRGPALIQENGRLYLPEVYDELYPGRRQGRR